MADKILLSKKSTLVNFFSRFTLSVLLLAACTGAYADVFNVNTTADGTSYSGTVNLRGAFMRANTLGGTHTINVPAGTYQLTQGTISIGDVAQNITINGAGAASTIINMSTTSQDRILLIDPPGTNSNIIVSITGISFTNGVLNGDPYGGGAICAGGPGNSLTLTNCNFSNNTLSAGSGGTVGGAISFSGGGTLTANGCNFTNNTSPGTGGAIIFAAYSYNIGTTYTYPGNTLSVTNCTFTGNKANAGSGGAIHVSAAGYTGAAPVLSISIKENSFVSNSAFTANGKGGAVSTVNSFSTTAVFNINYNRFFGNTSDGIGSALYMADTQGGVNATNNWWSCNTGASGCANKAQRESGASPGVLNVSSYLQLKTALSPAALCTGSSGTVTASFIINPGGAAVAAADAGGLANAPVSFSGAAGSISSAQTVIQADGTATATYTATSGGAGTATANVDNAAIATGVTNTVAPSFTTAPAAATVCTNYPATFTAAGSGTPTYQWYKGATALTNGTTANGSVISGVATATLSFAGVATGDAGTDYNVVITNGGCSSTSANVALNVTAPNIAAATTTATRSVSTVNNLISNGSCVVVAKVLPSGTSPVTGNVTATVTITPTVQTTSYGTPYVQRHYDITPATAAATATATITLYFTQAEFTAYNTALGGSSLLPINSADAANNKANIRVYQFHGTGTLPVNYTGTQQILIPTSVTYNSTYSRWEVTVSVNGFSGFYLANAANALPVDLVSFTGSTDNTNVFLKWETAQELSFNHFEVERSTDGISFKKIGSVPGGNRAYSYTDVPEERTTYYYRLKMVDNDGQFKYSNTIRINMKKKTDLSVTPNPFKDAVKVNLQSPVTTTAQLTIIAADGRIILKKAVSIQKGTNTINLDGLGGMGAGVYVLQVQSEDFTESLKVIKQ